MPRCAEVIHREWIAAPLDTVSAQFADLDHHIECQVHPKLRLEVLERRPRGARFLQEVRLLGLRQRDIFERRIEPDGSIEDRSVEGVNRGGSLSFRFSPQVVAGRAGTVVEITIRLPLPPLIGPLLRPLLEKQVRKEVRAAALEDKRDLESGGYPAAQRARPALVAA